MTSGKGSRHGRNRYISILFKSCPWCVSNSSLYCYTDLYFLELLEAALHSPSNTEGILLTLKYASSGQNLELGCSDRQMSSKELNLVLDCH